MLAAPQQCHRFPAEDPGLASDDRGKVWISYNGQQYLQKRHGLPRKLLANIAVVETSAAKVAE